jgi:hypothetical protein
VTCEIPRKQSDRLAFGRVSYFTIDLETSSTGRRDGETRYP